jgi:hypothetical protein
MQLGLTTNRIVFKVSPDKPFRIEYEVLWINVFIFLGRMSSEHIYMDIERERENQSDEFVFSVFFEI